MLIYLLGMGIRLIEERRQWIAKPTGLPIFSWFNPSFNGVLEKETFSQTTFSEDNVFGYYMQDRKYQRGNTEL